MLIANLHGPKLIKFNFYFRTLGTMDYSPNTTKAIVVKSILYVKQCKLKTIISIVPLTCFN